MFYLRLIPIIVVLLGIIYVGYLKKFNSSLKLEKGLRESYLIEKDQTIRKLELLREQDQKKILEYNQKIINVEKVYKSDINYLKKQKQAKEVIISDLRMANDRVNDDFNKLLNSISCASGSVRSCKTTSIEAPRTDRSSGTEASSN